MAIARLLLVAPVAVIVGMALPGPARATSIGPVHLGNRPVVSDNWVDNASAPREVAVGACTLLAAAAGTPHAGHSIGNGVAQQGVSHSPSELLNAAVAETIDALRVIADLSGPRADFRSVDR